MKTVYSLFENSILSFFIEMTYTKELILSQQALLYKFPFPSIMKTMTKLSCTTKGAFGYTC